MEISIFSLCSGTLRNFKLLWLFTTLNCLQGLVSNRGSGFSERYFQYELETLH